MHGFKSEDVGEVTERLLISAVADSRRPKWLIKVERADAHLDVLGVDALAHIVYPDGRQGRIIIQVKSSYKAIAEYYRKHPWAAPHEVVCICISPNKDSNAMICARLYEQLQDRRTKNVWHEGCLNWLSGKRLNESGVQRERKITEGRTRNITYPHKQRSSKVLERFRLWWRCWA